jgi:hypothetical protein
MGHDAVQVERYHIDLVGTIEPVLGTEAPRFRAGNLLGHGLLLSASRLMCGLSALTEQA